MGLFDPFKDVKDGFLLDEEEITAKEEVVDEEQGSEEQDDDATVRLPFVYLLFFCMVGF